MATDSSLRKGDRVRVTYDATFVVEAAHGSSIQAYVDMPDGSQAIIPHGAQVELIERPDDLQDGDVVLDYHYCWFHRIGDAEYPWRRFGDETKYSDNYLTRPFKLHLRDGQPVTP